MEFDGLNGCKNRNVSKSLYRELAFSRSKENCYFYMQQNLSLKTIKFQNYSFFFKFKIILEVFLIMNAYNNSTIETATTPALS